ncbi:MAG: ATP-dependent 6-phosphofructokinase, partial [Sedimentisphaerales bacterium]|nr:ATP-dependent 6-phosphofructokinase [Sedimentisphaerales bacterium]
MSEMDFRIDMLGEATIASPILLSHEDGDFQANYVGDGEYIAHAIDLEPGPEDSRRDRKFWLEKAGPREKIYFDPAQTHAAIVTCGGLCPGLNDVIRSIVMCLWYRYGVRKITGFRFGYRGLTCEAPFAPIYLSASLCEDIHQKGGTLLGSARGYGDRTGEIVDTLVKRQVSLLFTIGGDGTQKGALRIAEEIARRGLKIAVIGIPKTIDNDLSFVEKSFGFETAVAKAVEAVDGAHVEAHDAIRGIGLVRLMGRQSGFIAASAALGSNDVNYVLVPEVPFELDGPNGLLAHLEHRLDKRNHAVIVVAEGAGQDLLAK